MQYQFKAGDRVKHTADGEQGTFIQYDLDGDAIVLWDRNGEEVNDPKYLVLIDIDGASLKELDAVLLLLSLGYSISKGNQ